MKNSKERLKVTGQMTSPGANIAGILLAAGAAAFLVLSGMALVLAAG